MTYRNLRTVVLALKEEGARLFPTARIEVGETFDIGPEFAVSDFKYRRHTEICSGTALDTHRFVDATARLHADPRPYAAYPNGIPEGEPFGTFLAKQVRAMFRDIPLDYLWLSNGLGFSASPWDAVGKIFDGERFYPERLSRTRDEVFAFWRMLRDGAPDIPIEVRGTNHSVGIDYATDGVPLYDIYTKELGITAPPNSPRAAINDNVGLELMGHMTRTAELPSDRFPFRYYVHDPWWVNSPWYDRYDGAPYDIYLPMSVTRIGEDGKPEVANALNILSVDNSYGGMPEACVNEVIPHLLKAEKDAPDAIAPLVWVYPMREYTNAHDEQALSAMYEGDTYIMDAINAGLPLSTVVSADIFFAHAPGLYRGCILLCPATLEARITEHLAGGGDTDVRVMVYGRKEHLASAMAHGHTCLDTEADASLCRHALERFGYRIRHTRTCDGAKVPTMTLVRRDGGYIFSVYNPDTTTDTALRLPLGAPVLIGTECVMKGGDAHYHFSRAEHRECRILVEQASEGTLSCRECAPVSTRYRRCIRLRGLCDATVRLIPELSCECLVNRADDPDDTPLRDEAFTLVHHPLYGTYLEGHHISGDLLFRIGHKR